MQGFLSQSDSSTFDKNLRVALLLPDHALISCVIRQVALVDSECPLVAHALEHIPGRTWGKVIRGTQRGGTKN